MGRYGHYLSGLKLAIFVCYHDFHFQFNHSSNRHEGSNIISRGQTSLSVRVQSGYARLLKGSKKLTITDTHRPGQWLDNHVWCSKLLSQ